MPMIASAHCDLSERPTMTELAAMIRSQECQIRSLEDVLPHLPDSMKLNFVLFYKSRSIQAPFKTDYVHPRAILYTDTTPEFFVTFNGAVSQTGFRSLEILQSDLQEADPAKMFQFFYINFPKDDSSQSWDQIQSQIEVSDSNPITCTICHGDPARPLFPGFPKWEGTYGSFLTKINPEEEAGLERFLQEKKQSRYRILNWDVDRSSDLLSGLANAQLNSKLSQLNSVRVAKLVRSSANYADYKYAVLGALLDCPRYPEFFPQNIEEILEEALNIKFDFDNHYSEIRLPSFLEALLQPGYSEFGEIGDFYPRPQQSSMPPEKALLENLQSYSGNSLRLTQMVIDTFTQQGAARTSGNIAKLRFVMEGRGIDIYDWFMDPTPSTYREMGGVFILRQLEKDADFADLQAGLEDLNESNYQGLCSTLRKKSLESLSKRKTLHQITAQ